MENKIKELRDYYGISQRELGEMAGIGAATICNIECGRHSPGLETAMRIGLALKTSVENIFYLQGSYGNEQR